MLRNLSVLVLLIFLTSVSYAAPPSAAALTHSVPSIAAMRSLNEKYSDLRVIGYYEGSIKGGGDFTWDPTSTAASDACTIFPGDSPKGRWLRRLPTSQLDVTMCGAKWDGTSDDAPAISAAFSAASRAGLSVSCPGGTGRIANTVSPPSFTGVVFRCQGMNASVIRCTVSKKPCFLFQNEMGLAGIQAPQFYDFKILSVPSPAYASTIIQYNSLAGGFIDGPNSQSYMMRPIIQGVWFEDGEIGVQCSKCFDGDISLNMFIGQFRHGVDLEGSDWMGVGAAGTNRFISTREDSPIRIASHGTFGNGALVTHNDILAPFEGVRAYIYSSGRTTYIEKNFLEGTTKGACEILIDNGALHATVRDNHVTDPTVANWLCVVPRLAQGEFTSNQTTGWGQGPARFENGRGPFNNIYPQTIVHFGNWSEAGFP
jgi:hypothetical protein